MNSHATWDSATVIHIDGVTRRFGPTTALDDVSLSVPRGTVFGLVGANGAGKTTLIKHVLGLLKAQTGRVHVVLRRHAVAQGLVVRLLVAWLVAAVTLIGLLSWLIPGTLAPRYLVASCVVLALPLVRISLAPLALAWNRHR